MLHHSSSGGATSFSIFPTSGKQAMESDPYDYAYSSSSVDCTLSLGTPSTRQTPPPQKPSSSVGIHRTMSTLCSWDIISQSGKSSSQSSAGGGGDPLLLARRCANCDTTSTPLWRNGPHGPKSLCNACGIRYKKEERRASSSSSAKVAPGAYSYQRAAQWKGYAQTAADGDEERDGAYLSWRLNVVPTNRSSLF